ncbi:hypothetical protein PybrP1_005427 [[Pythium] brassicae (nom. inval.)]|nr:hypothetical protein PybrP1_005427 [[Pythium] brassicae (nom. inval.)]
MEEWIVNLHAPYTHTHASRSQADRAVAVDDTAEAVAAVQVHELALALGRALGVRLGADAQRAAAAARLLERRWAHRCVLAHVELVEARLGIQVQEVRVRRVERHALHVAALHERLGELLVVLAVPLRQPLLLHVVAHEAVGHERDHERLARRVEAHARVHLARPRQVRVELHRVEVVDREVVRRVARAQPLAVERDAERQDRRRLARGLVTAAALGRGVERLEHLEPREVQHRHLVRAAADHKARRVRGEREHARRVAGGRWQRELAWAVATRCVQREQLELLRR